jgi:hypothetical protein
MARKVILGLGISIDGYIARRNGALDGIPGFPGKFPQRDFKLTECKSYSNGSVGLRYERVRVNTNR